MMLLLHLSSIHRVEAQSYCTPMPATTFNNFIVNVTTTGGIVNISNPTSETTTSGYHDYTTTHYVSATPGSTINIDALTCGTTSIWCSTSFMKVYVDWNQDGDFYDLDEEVYAYTISGGSYTFVGSFIVPTHALTGTTRMRFMSEWSGSSTTIGPCVSTGWGEVEDYGFVVISLDPCTGTPSGGTANATPSSGNMGSSFTLSAAGASAAVDFEYQWQISDDGVSGWTDIAGATSFSYIATAPMVVPITKYYRLKITCPTSGMSSYSSTTTFTTAVVYCTPSASSPSINYITNVTISGGVTGFSNSTSTYSLTGSGYSDFYSTIGCSAVQGSSVNFSVTETGSLGRCRIWVDWNQDGDFDDPGEEVYVFASGGSYTFTGSFTVPMSALPGDTRMRVRTNWESGTTLTPCTLMDYGEAEDYKFTVIEALPCSGTPTGGTASISLSSGPAGGPITLTTSGTSAALDMEYQWEMSSDGSTWTSIAGATDVTFTTTSESVFDVTYYRLRVTCPTSGETVYSTEVTYTGLAIVCSDMVSNGHSYYTIMFHVQNTNSYPISVNSISSQSYYTGTYSYRLFYNPTAIYSSGSSWTAGPVGDGVGGWVAATPATSVYATALTTTELLSGFDVVIPPGSTYTFYLSSSSSNIALRYLSGESGVYEYGSGVKIITGDNIGNRCTTPQKSKKLKILTS